jgi:hypothetical protein
MKKIGVWNYYESLNTENYLLLNKDAGIGDNLLEPFNKLYLKGQDENIDFMTIDMIDTFEDMDGFIFFDFPNLKNDFVKKVFKIDAPKYLVIFESELIKPENWNLDNHKLFDKIFTWNDDIVDNKKYFKFNFAQSIPKYINKDLSKKEKLCTLIAGNKKNNHSLELYSKRVEAIRWFENNHSEDFDFYGIGWDKNTNSNKYVRFLFNKLKLFQPSYENYRGMVDAKKEVLEKYKFAICYENARDIPGYITEKIFDCFFAGCVPVYWGANNIVEHIPKECFIDKREYDTYEKLYNFIYNMSDEEYLGYLNNIEIYLNSEDIDSFSSDFFANNIIEHVK